jgi:hypothetical protein
VLAVLPAAEHPTPAIVDRLTREYGLKDELDGAWAVRPLELIREHGRIMLVLENTRSEPLDRSLGVPMEVCPSPETIRRPHYMLQWPSHCATQLR